MHRHFVQHHRRTPDLVAPLDPATVTDPVKCEAMIQHHERARRQLQWLADGTGSAYTAATFHAREITVWQDRQLELIAPAAPRQLALLS